MQPDRGNLLPQATGPRRRAAIVAAHLYHGALADGFVK